MNTFFKVSRVLVVATAAFIGSAHASQGQGFTWSQTGKKFAWQTTCVTVGMPHTQYVVVAAVDKTFKSPVANVATSTGMKAAQIYITNQLPCTNPTCPHSHKKDNVTMAKDVVAYAVVNSAVRYGSNYASNNGYEVGAFIKKAYNAVMPEGAVKDAVGELAHNLAPVAQEVAYDLITESIIASATKLTTKGSV